MIPVYSLQQMYTFMSLEPEKLAAILQYLVISPFPDYITEG